MDGDSEGEELNLPSAEECDRISKEFAEVTGTDEACAHFFLQDYEWKLKDALNAFFDSDSAGEDSVAQSQDEPHASGSRGKSSSNNSQDTDLPVTCLKLISWNVDGIDEKNLITRIKAVCTVLIREKPHVVFLQEVVAEAYSVIDEYLREEYLLISGRNESSLIPYFTVMLLKKKEVHCIKQHVKPFPTTMMGRTLLTVEADINGLKLFLMTVHLESTKDFERERKKQLHSAFQACLNVPKDKSVIFGGDLNARDKELDDVGGVPEKLVDVWGACGAKKFTEFTWDRVKNDNIAWEGRFKPRCRFDRIYINKEASFKPKDFMLVGTERIRSCLCFPSDHWGIMCTFQLHNK